MSALEKPGCGPGFAGCIVLQSMPSQGTSQKKKKRSQGIFHLSKENVQGSVRDIPLGSARLYLL